MVLDLGLQNKDPKMKLHCVMHYLSGPVALKPIFFLISIPSASACWVLSLFL